MPRTYTDAEKQQAMNCLAINNGDVMLTSVQTGIPERTLYYWSLRAKKILQSQSPQSPQTSSPSTHPPVGAQHVAPSSSPPAPIPTDPDLINTLTDLQAKMKHAMNLLADSIPEAIADAPLNQRILALVHLIDRIVKLNAQLPNEVEIEVTDHVEKKYEEEENEDADSPADTPPSTTGSAGIG